MKSAALFRHRLARRVMSILLPAFMAAGCATIGEPLPPPPTLAEIVESSKSGQPPNQIIERMQRSRAVYRLQASELARLREQGVADEVIDYMQRVHLEVVRMEESVRARHFYGPGWGPGWGPVWGPWGHDLGWWHPSRPYRRF